MLLEVAIYNDTMQTASDEQLKFTQDKCAQAGKLGLQIRQIKISLESIAHLGP